MINPLSLRSHKAVSCCIVSDTVAELLLHYDEALSLIAVSACVSVTWSWFNADRALIGWLGFMIFDPAVATAWCLLCLPHLIITFFLHPLFVCIRTFIVFDQWPVTVVCWGLVIPEEEKGNNLPKYTIPAHGDKRVALKHKHYLDLKRGILILFCTVFTCVTFFLGLFTAWAFSNSRLFFDVCHLIKKLEPHSVKHWLSSFSSLQPCIVFYGVL